MSPDAPLPSDPVEPLADEMRRHLDRLNRHFVNLHHGLKLVEAALAEAISEHLDAIGLDDLTNPT